MMLKDELEGYDLVMEESISDWLRKTDMKLSGEGDLWIGGYWLTHTECDAFRVWFENPKTFLSFLQCGAYRARVDRGGTEKWTLRRGHPSMINTPRPTPKGEEI